MTGARGDGRAENSLCTADSWETQAKSHGLAGAKPPRWFAGFLLLGRRYPAFTVPHGPYLQKQLPVHPHQGQPL